MRPLRWSSSSCRNGSFDASSTRTTNASARYPGIHGCRLVSMSLRWPITRACRWRSCSHSSRPAAPPLKPRGARQQYRMLAPCQATRCAATISADPRSGLGASSVRVQSDAHNDQSGEAPNSTGASESRAGRHYGIGRRPGRGGADLRRNACCATVERARPELAAQPQRSGMQHAHEGRGSGGLLR